jgi:hypothetical protein
MTKNACLVPGRSPGSLESVHEKSPTTIIDLQEGERKARAYANACYRQSPWQVWQFQRKLLCYLAFILFGREMKCVRS